MLVSNVHIRLRSNLQKLKLDVLSIIAQTFPTYYIFPFLSRKIQCVIPQLKNVLKENSKYIWSIQEAHSRQPLKYKKYYATVYLVEFRKIKDNVFKCGEFFAEYLENWSAIINGNVYKDFYVNNVTIEMLDMVYPTLVNRLDRGDIIEFIDKSGYRSQGIMFFDGEKLIEQCTNYDSYGTPPIEFEIITEFPPEYFTRPYVSITNLHVVNDYVCSKNSISKFYWHCDMCYMALNIKKLGLIDKISLALNNTIDRDRYIQFTYKGITVLLRLSYDIRLSDLQKITDDGIIFVNLVHKQLDPNTTKYVLTTV